MITLQDICLQRGNKILLQHANLSIHDGKRIGVIGANGSGKSSFFGLLTGNFGLDAGSISGLHSLRMAHMAQEVSSSERSSRDYIIDGDQNLRRIETALTKAELSENYTELATLHGELDAIDGYTAERRAETLMRGLGFEHSDCDRKVSDFSGGWRIRLNLAQALMCPSDLLLLDEPTNHLDLDATLWLEQWLNQYRGTLLMISHDRDFIDAICSNIVSLEQKQLHSYRGNYSAFEIQRAERLSQQQASYQKQQQRIAEIDNFVRRFRAKATKAKQAQSRIKELERMEKIVPAHIDSPFHFSFYSAERASDPMLAIKAAQMGYADDTILSNVSINLHPGSRIALLGPNGAGKSTLLKSLVAELPLIAGEIVRGEHCAIGYFNQHQLEALDLNASALLHLQRLRPTAREQEIRNFLGGFNFHGDTATGSIEHFSGGEKARLALAIIVWQKPNLLVLDEPTNHLDLEMRQALTEALQGYEGAVILVSHDRYLLRNTVDNLLLVNDGRVDEYEGDLSSYEKWLLEQYRQKPNSKPVDIISSAPEKKVQRRSTAQIRQQLSPLKKDITKIEKSIATLEAQLANTETLLSDVALYETGKKSQLQEILLKQSSLKKQQQASEEHWLELQRQLEELGELGELGELE
jgi:ATP-binding cassette subfamily F protein 3